MSIIKPCDGDSTFSLMTVFQEKYDEILYVMCFLNTKCELRELLGFLIKDKTGSTNIVFWTWVHKVSR